MSNRFSDIAKAPELSKALNGYRNYLDPTTRQTKRMTGGSRSAARIRATDRGYVIPFGMVSSASAFKGYRVTYDKKNVSAFAGFNTAIVTPGRLKDTVPVAEEDVWFDKPLAFKPARAAVFVPEGGTTPDYVQSKITTLYYLKYKGKSYTLPFGAINETEEAASGYAAVKAALRAAAGTTAYYRVSVSSEVLDT